MNGTFGIEEGIVLSAPEQDTDESRLQRSKWSLFDLPRALPMGWYK
jgi:hypothetical protein